MKKFANDEVRKGYEDYRKGVNFLEITDEEIKNLFAEHGISVVSIKRGVKDSTYHSNVLDSYEIFDVILVNVNEDEGGSNLYNDNHYQYAYLLPTVSGEIKLSDALANSLYGKEEYKDDVGFVRDNRKIKALINAWRNFCFKKEEKRIKATELSNTIPDNSNA